MRSYALMFIRSITSLSASWCSECILASGVREMGCNRLASIFGVGAILRHTMTQIRCTLPDKIRNITVRLMTAIRHPSPPSQVIKDWTITEDRSEENKTPGQIRKQHTCTSLMMLDSNRKTSCSLLDWTAWLKSMSNRYPQSYMKLTTKTLRVIPREWIRKIDNDDDHDYNDVYWRLLFAEYT